LVIFKDFDLVIFFKGFDFIFKHVTFGLVETFEIIKQALAKELMNLLDEYGLRTKIIIYIKDEGSNLNIMTNVRKSMSNVALGLEENFHWNMFWACFLHNL
jgi:hypothetical protein